jgi:hypothetical protein
MAPRRTHWPLFLAANIEEGACIIESGEAGAGLSLKAFERSDLP